jgi:drug/metabolite transporter (DMT)-like permease
MSAFLIILLVFLSIVVDFGTTAVGASDQFGPAGVAISLVLQLGQLASLVMLRAEEARERPLLRWSLLSIAAVITAINALFNYYALHGIPEGPSDPLYVLRTLTP